MGGCFPCGDGALLCFTCCVSRGYSFGPNLLVRPGLDRWRYSLGLATVVSGCGKVPGCIFIAAFYFGSKPRGDWR